MSLASRLRSALALPIDQNLELIEGDSRDQLLDEGQTVTPAAVLVPIVDRAEPTLILTLRPDTLRNHAGQIAFPGGRIDPTDDGPISAALREAEEEIHLPREQVEIIGVADRYRTVTGFEVTPVVGIVPAGIHLRPQPGEVAAIFEVPLDHLLNPAHQIERTVDWQDRKRHYYEIMWQDRRIWGATAAMIVNLGRRMA